MILIDENQIIAVFEGRGLSSEQKRQYRKDGYAVYDMRHPDDNPAVPSTIEDNVVVNYFGTIVLKDARLAKDDEFRDLTEDEIGDIMYALQPDEDQ